MWRVHLTDPSYNRDSATAHPFKQSLIDEHDEVREIITGLVIFKLDTWGKIRIIRMAFIVPFEWLEKLVEGDFILYPV